MITKIFRMLRRQPVAVTTVTLIALLALVRADRLAHAHTEELTIKASFADKPVAPSEAIDLRVNRPLQNAEGKLAVIIGQTDFTNLFVATEDGLSFAPRPAPLPMGENEVTVYLVSAENNWREIARFTLRVVESQPASGSLAPGQTVNDSSPAKKAGFTFAPALTLSLKSQPAESHAPLSNQPPRQTFTDLAVQGGAKAAFAHGDVAMQSSFDIAGSSYEKEALRFAQIGDRAPQIDLSSYLMQFNVGKARFLAGHVAVGSNRFLIQNFSSRGISVLLPLGPRTDVAFAALNGTSIVGWDNFFGLDSRKHQILTGTLGFDFLRERPGGLRIETSFLSGSLQPLSNFNQGNINDAERSDGAGFRLLASDKAQRFKFDGGFTVSAFTNRRDALLEQGRAVSPAPESTRDARYVDASLALLQNLALGKDLKANLIFNYRHEKVDPLFRSVAAYVQPNRFQNQFEMVGNLGNITATVSHLRFNDNLDNLSSILKSLTRRNTFLIGAPTAALFRNPAKPSAWLPRLSYSFDRTHQFGAFLPTNAEFKEPQVPNQIGTNQMLTSEWQGNRYLRFGYRANYSTQYNFGQKREDTKLKNFVNGLMLGLSPHSALDVNFDIDAERLQSLDNNGNKDRERLDHTLRFGVNLNWRMTGKAVLNAVLSNTANHSAGDLYKTNRGRNADFDLQWSWRFGFEKSRYNKLQGQFFVRYANHYNRFSDDFFKLSTLKTSNTLNTGVSFTLF